MTYNVGISRRPDGLVEGWALDLPGCRAIGSSYEEMVSLMPVAIGEYLAWMDRHGDLSPQAYPIEWKAVENIETSGDFVFEAEKQPLSQHEAEGAIRSITNAHEDLMSVVKPLVDVVRDWKPPAGTVKIDAIYPDVRTIRDMTSHVASAMTFHIRAIGDVVSRVPGPADASDLQGAYEATAARIRALTERERSGEVFTQTSPRNISEWTARKSVRRIVNHQRFHTREIEQRLCWLSWACRTFCRSRESRRDEVPKTLGNSPALRLRRCMRWQ